MKLLILSTCDNLIDGQQKALEDSLIKHGYDYEFFLYGFIFGEQYRVIKTFVEQYKGDATHILYTDMFDTIALAPPSEVIAKFCSIQLTDIFNGREKTKMIIGVEKACFPNDERDKYHRTENYPESPTAWKYINGGGCIFEIDYFKELCNQHPFNEDRMMDPDWLAELYQSHPDQIKLDYQCSIFQCLAHSNQDEWETIDNRIGNIATQSKPIFIHGNGKTDMKWIKQIATEQTK